jgi:hypothetical protein
MATLSMAPCAAYDLPVMQRVDWSGVEGALSPTRPPQEPETASYNSFLPAGSALLSYESALRAFRSMQRPIDRYIALRDLLSASPQVYYELLLAHTEEILPYIYTVRSCKRWWPRW